MRLILRFAQYRIGQSRLKAGVDAKLESGDVIEVKLTERHLEPNGPRLGHWLIQTQNEDGNEDDGGQEVDRVTTRANPCGDRTPLRFAGDHDSAARRSG